MGRTRPARRRNGGSLRPYLALALLILGVALPLLLPDLPPKAPAPLPQGEARRQIEAALPPELDPLRRELVSVAAALVDQVGYFWGGKSDRLGWDSRWGVPAVVSSLGSESTGTCVPFGLDCSGYVSWAAVNAVGDAQAYSAMGDGVRDQWSRCTGVDWAEAQPGDLAFFPDLSHIGIVAGRGADGGILVLHCSSSLGGVVCSPDGAATGFTLLGQPDFYALYGPKPSELPLTNETTEPVS